MLAGYPQSAKTVWITEFGTESPEMVTWFLLTYQQDPRVTRWAYFAPRIPESEPWLHRITLIDPQGNLTPVGRAYVEALKR